MPRSWKDKHDNHKHPAQLEKLDKPYAGLMPGATIVIATPRDMSDYFRSIPRGETRTMEQLRAHLARKYKADGACPLTTGIFCRIASENSLDMLETGATVDEVAPFWRAVDPKSPLAKKLRCGPEFIREQRMAEEARR